jgi:hypothetical protein
MLDEDRERREETEDDRMRVESGVGGDQRGTERKRRWPKA